MSGRVRLRRRLELPAELRASESDGSRRLEGYAAVFDSETVIAELFREIVRPGAFRKTLQESDQVALWNHDTNYPLGRRSTGTLELEEDHHGLRARITLPETDWGRNAWESVQRGDVQGMSFGFDVIQDRWTRDRESLDLRELLEIRLWEVSPVTFPAYEATEVEARAILENCGVVTLVTTEPVEDHSAADTGPERRRRVLEAYGAVLRGDRMGAQV